MLSSFRPRIAPGDMADPAADGSAVITFLRAWRFLMMAAGPAFPAPPVHRSRLRDCIRTGGDGNRQSRRRGAAVAGLLCPPGDVVVTPGGRFGLGEIIVAEAVKTG